MFVPLALIKVMAERLELDLPISLHGWLYLLGPFVMVVLIVMMGCQCGWERSHMIANMRAVLLPGSATKACEYA